jgi:hypothetical protein
MFTHATQMRATHLYGTFNTGNLINSRKQLSSLSLTAKFHRIKDFSNVQLLFYKAIVKQDALLSVKLLGLCKNTKIKYFICSSQFQCALYCQLN